MESRGGVSPGAARRRGGLDGALRRNRRAPGKMCSGSEAGSYLRRIDFVCHSTLGLRVIHKKKSCTRAALPPTKESEP